MKTRVSLRHRSFWTSALVWLSLAALCATRAHAQDDGIRRPSAVAVANLNDHDFPDFHEDWKSIKLDTSTLKIKNAVAVAGIPSKSSDFTLEMTQVKWRPSDPIDLYIALPKGVEKPPVIIYLYNGLPVYEKRYKDDGWYTRVTFGGYAAVAFVPAMSGSRFHAPRPLNQNFLNHLQEALAVTTHDVQMVINYLQTRKDLNLDLSRIGVFGQGSGATVAILSAAADPRIKAIDVLASWGDWPDWIAKTELTGFYDCDICKKPEFLENLAPLDPVKWLPALKTPSIRIRDFRSNPDVPDAAQERIEAAAPKQAQVVRFDGVEDFNYSAGGGRTFDWIKSVFKTDAPTPPAENKAETKKASPSESPR